MADATGDLFGIWRNLMQQWESQTNAAITELTKKEEFSREMNRAMSVNLRMQAAFNEAVEKALATLNLPSRDDLARVSERLVAIERKLDLLADKAGVTDVPPPIKAKRTRRPPEAKPTS